MRRAQALMRHRCVRRDNRPSPLPLPPVRGPYLSVVLERQSPGVILECASEGGLRVGARLVDEAAVVSGRAVLVQDPGKKTESSAQSDPWPTSSRGTHRSMIR
jgi:hypothetical protein